MSLLSKLLKLWLVGETVSATTPLFMRLLMGVAAITMLAIFAAIVMAMLLGGVIWVSYIQLIEHGLTQPQAVLAIGGALLAMLVAALAQIRGYCNDATCVIKRIMHLQSPVSTRVSSLSEAFMNGYHQA